MLLSVAAVLLVAGCGTAGSHIRSEVPAVSQPEITKIEVRGANPGEGQQWVLGEDFVMLSVDIANPEATGVSGEIACKPRGAKGSRGVRQFFSVDARSHQQVTIPVDERKSYSYTLRCRLQYDDTLLGGGPATSDWVEVAVPARG
jgi:hypothetical protein